MGGLTLEFELVNASKECVISEPYSSLVYPQLKPTCAPMLLGANMISTEWDISEVMVKVDIITIDVNLNNEYVKYLLEGKALAINYNTYVSQIQNVYGQENSVNITRSLSRLKSIFVSHVGEMFNPESIVHKEFNTFYHPMSQTVKHDGMDLYDADRELQWQIQIGSKMFPAMSCRSTSESWYQLQKCLGILNSSFHSIDIDSKEYRHYKYVIGMDLDKSLQSGFTGLNTKAGDLISIKTKCVSADKCPTKMHVILHTDLILYIRDGGCEVFE